MTRDVVALGLPLAPLCRPDCAGPAPDGFPLSVAEDPVAAGASTEERPRDPRWAALDELRAEFEIDSDATGEVG